MGKDDKSLDEVMDLQKPTAARARNKTVMLTPEIANQMRSRINAGVHRSGSTEKIDANLLNEIRNAPKEEGVNPLDSIAERLDSEDLSTEKPDFGMDSYDEGAGKGFEDAFEDKMDPFVSNSMDEAVEPVGTFEPAETVIAEEAQPATVSGGLSINDLIKQQSAVEESAVEDRPFASVPSLEPAEVEPLSQLEPSPVEELENNEPVYNLGQGDLHEDHPESQDTINQIENFQEEIPVSESTNVVKTSQNQKTSMDYSTQGGDFVRWSKKTALTGFLVSFQENKEGDYFVLRAGRLIVSSDDSAQGSLLMLQDETVSPMHAIIRVAEKNVIVLDQLSENGTSVTRADGEQLELSGDKTNLQHGDEISFGDKTFKVCLLS